MKVSIDLISDLHIETWEEFDWAYQATSPYCVVAGDVARDLGILKRTLTHLGRHYEAVFYIDGNDEHRYNIDEIGDNYHDLEHIIGQIPNVVFLHENVAVVNGLAILGTNGWFTWDLDPNIQPEDCQRWYLERINCASTTPSFISAFAQADAAYLKNSIQRLQTHQDIKKILVVTHTVPHRCLVDHDLDLIDTYRFNCIGNSRMLDTLTVDTERKIDTWAFGHYHGDVDRIIDGVRFVNNCRGRGDTPWKKSVYYPKRLVFEF